MNFRDFCAFAVSFLMIPFFSGCGEVEVSDSSPGVLSASQISAGGSHSCALIPDNTVRCWGDNTFGQLGRAVGFNALSPVEVSGISTAAQVSAGGAHTCALLSDGTVACWGRNSSGQLGNGGFSNTVEPAGVSGLSGVVSVSSGSEHACAALSSGGVRCWGNNSFGQLGDGTRSSPKNVPTAVSGISAASAVTAGTLHSCALLRNGNVRCWGDNSLGQLGNGTITRSDTPVEVLGITTAVEVSAGTDFTCARLSDGTVRCWGSNASAQLGAPWTLTGPFAVNISAEAASSVQFGREARSVSAGGSHACSIDSASFVRCWGENSSGQLGNGTFTGFASPGPGAPSTVTYIPLTASGATVEADAGGNHTCARDAGGQVWCWGYGLNGELGNNTGRGSSVPVQVLR